VAAKRICSIEGCGKQHRSRGWCRTHYDRWLLNGDPLKGRAFKGEPQRFLETAIAFSGDECLIWPYARTQKGRYAKVRIAGVDHIVSRLVCEAVHGKSPTSFHQAAHSCGRGSDGCVNPRHLRWATPVENADDRRAHGTVLCGERNPSAKLTYESAEAIREIFRRNPKATLASVGRIFGVSKATVGKVRNNQMWTSQIG